MLHHVYRDAGEADWSVVPWIHFFALPGDVTDILVVLSPNFQESPLIVMTFS